LLNTYPQLDKAWTGQEALPLLLFFLLLFPYSFFLLLDKHAGVREKKDIIEQDDKLPNRSHIRLRFVSCTLSVVERATIVAGLVALFVLAMIFHPLAASAFGGLFTVAGLAWKLIRDRSFQSATGMLYLVVVCALAGEAMARGLFLGHL